MTTMTLEEQERRAYIDGDVDTAKLLAFVCDEFDRLNNELYRLNNEADDLSSL